MLKLGAGFYASIGYLVSKARRACRCLEEARHSSERQKCRDEAGPAISSRLRMEVYPVTLAKVESFAEDLLSHNSLLVPLKCNIGLFFQPYLSSHMCVPAECNGPKVRIAGVCEEHKGAHVAGSE